MHSFFFFFVVVVVHLQWDGITQKFLSWSRMEGRSGEEWRFHWETLSEAQGNGFEQRSAGSALASLAKNEINLKSSQKAQEEAVQVLQCRSLGWCCGSVWVMQSSALPPSKSSRMQIHLVALLQLLDVLAWPQDVLMWSYNNLKKKSQNPSKNQIKPPLF